MLIIGEMYPSIPVCVNSLLWCVMIMCYCIAFLCASTHMLMFV